MWQLLVMRQSSADPGEANGRVLHINDNTSKWSECLMNPRGDPNTLANNLSNTLATWFKGPAHWKRPWCWERLRAGGEGDKRGWGGWVASLTQWTWVWANSGRQLIQGSLACCSSWGHRVRHNWVTEQKGDPNFRNASSGTPSRMKKCAFQLGLVRRLWLRFDARRAPKAKTRQKVWVVGSRQIRQGLGLTVMPRELAWGSWSLPEPRGARKEELAGSQARKEAQLFPGMLGSWAWFPLTCLILSFLVG